MWTFFRFFYDSTAEDIKCLRLAREGERLCSHSLHEGSNHHQQTSLVSRNSNTAQLVCGGTTVRTVTQVLLVSNTLTIEDRIV